MIALYIIYAVLSFLFNIFVVITSPIWALIAAAFKLETLPGIFKWVHTHDNNIYGGLMPITFSQRFKAAVRWLCRNPGYGFDAFVLGFKSSNIEFQNTTGNYQLFESSTSAFQKDIMTLMNGSKRFSYRRNIPLWKNRYIKIWFGWHYLDQAGYRMLKFDINPFKRT